MEKTRFSLLSIYLASSSPLCLSSFCQVKKSYTSGFFYLTNGKGWPSPLPPHIFFILKKILVERFGGYYFVPLLCRTETRAAVYREDRRPLFVSGMLLIAREAYSYTRPRLCF